MKKLFAGLTALCMTAFGIQYCVLISQDEIQPTLSSWILFCVACTISFWTYWSTQTHSLMGNVANTLDVVLTWAVLAFMLCVGTNIRYHFRPVDTICLVASLGILVVWRLTRRHTLANVAIQIVMVIAYIPLLMNLLSAIQRPESISNWIIGWFGAVFALTSAILNRDRLGILYGLRASSLVTLTLFLLLRLEPA